MSFEIDSPAAEIELCHCSRCRKAYGSAFAATFVVEAARFRWQRGAELVTVFERPLERTPPPYRHAFCRLCGSPLPIEHPDLGLLEIPAGLIDGDPGCRPARHIYVGVKAPWFEIADALPRHETSPPRTP